MIECQYFIYRYSSYTCFKFSIMFYCNTQYIRNF